MTLINKVALTEGKSLYEQLRILAQQRSVGMAVDDQFVNANAVVMAWGNDPCRDPVELESLYDDFLIGIWNTNDSRTIARTQQ